MGKQGARRKKPRKHLPKVHGNAGALWDGESPVTYEQLERSVGRAGPKAQERYLRAHPSVAATGGASAGR